jgi:co-chaperonin GroES (HSP10)
MEFTIRSEFEDENTPDPTPLPKIARFNVLVRPLEVAKKSKGGIILADTTKEAVHYLQTCGRVVAMGPDCFPEGSTKSCEVGDVIVWGRGRGVRLKYKGVTFVLLVDDEVLMTIPDATDLDENYAVMKTHDQ